MLFNIMEPIAPDNYVAFTFFTGYIAMLAASVFFFVERGSVDDKWKMSLLVSALITGIAAVHYYYMRDHFGDRRLAHLFQICGLDTHSSIDVCRVLSVDETGWCKKESLVETHFGIYMDVSLWIHRRGI